jgi:hypothetical protein
VSPSLVFARPSKIETPPEMALGALGSVIEGVEPWEFGGVSGQTIFTRHFVIRTTERLPAIRERLPLLLETALGHYRSAITTLPAPPGRMETFVMDSRAQWRALVLEQLGPAAGPALNITRGGLTARGKALLFDIGSGDTLSVAAHEGWHQYTQSTFAQIPPVWMEEGMAVLMEGHRWVGPPARPVFGPWANMARYDRLVRAVRAGELMSLEQVLGSTPGGMIGMASPDGAGGDARGAGAVSAPINPQTPIVWYSQVWALMLWINEGEGGRYRTGLVAALEDARLGRLGPGVVARLNLGDDGTTRHPIGQGAGVLVFRAYVEPDLSRAEASYRQFLLRLTSNGVRSAVARGVSPLAEGH